MITFPPLYLPGDKVYYTGDKYKEKLHGKPGWVHAQVKDNPYAFIVEFPETRNNKDPQDTDDYIMPYTVIDRHRPHGAEKEAKEKKHEGPEIQPRRRAKRQEEE